jgi:hypothetical protein
MGWTGSTAPLSGLELKFPTLQSAIRYARRQALDFMVEGALPAGDAPQQQTRVAAVHGKQAA